MHLYTQCLCQSYLNKTGRKNKTYDCGKQTNNSKGKLEELSQNRAKRHRKGKYKTIVAQLVKNPLATWETWVRSLGWEDPLEKGKATHSSILAWRILWTV